MGKLIDRTGEKYTTTEGYEVEIVEYFTHRNCTIQFEDGTRLYNRERKDVQKGNVKNPFHKSIHGVGYLGVGPYGSKTKTYQTWKGMMNRCYDAKELLKCPTYIGCSVTEHWHNFQNFAPWFEENYSKEYTLDKDILLKGNKIYGSETCCFVPQEINKLFTKRQNKRGCLPIGVTALKNRYVAQIQASNKQIHIGCFSTPEEAFQAYKVAKEAHIKEMAEIWKDRIFPKVYEALYNYKVEITD